MVMVLGATSQSQKKKMVEVKTNMLASFPTLWFDPQ
jgi:hypothetical protein